VGQNVTETALSNTAPTTTGASTAAGFWDKINAFDIASQVVSSLNPEAGAALAFLRGGVVDGSGKFVGVGGTIQNLASTYGKLKAAQELERFAKKNGMSLAELNLALVALSFAGNKLVGTRFETDNFRRNEGEQGIRGILSRKEGGIIDSLSSKFFNKSIGLIFDITDIALGFQGLTTASGYDAIKNGDNTKSISGFSLGSMDANNLVARGYFPNGISRSFVFGNIAHSNVKVEIGALDIVNGFIIGKIFNPFSKLIFRNKGCFLHGASGCY
jgi:hypothetical protein